MLWTPHLLVGAALAKELQRPWTALPAAFASHFVLDFIPHLDSHGLFGVHGSGPTRMEVVSSSIDSLLGAALLIWAVSKQSNRKLLLLAGLFGVLPDLIYNIPPWGALFKTWPIFSQVAEFHTWFGHPVGPGEWPIGFGTQAVLVAMALWILVRKRKIGKAKCM